MVESLEVAFIPQRITALQKSISEVKQRRGRAMTNDELRETVRNLVDDDLFSGDMHGVISEFCVGQEEVNECIQEHEDRIDKITDEILSLVAESQPLRQVGWYLPTQGNFYRMGFHFSDTPQMAKRTPVYIKTETDLAGGDGLALDDSAGTIGPTGSAEDQLEGRIAASQLEDRGAG